MQEFRNASGCRLMRLVLPVVVTAVVSFDQPLLAQQMLFPADDWATATPESVLVDSQKLHAVLGGLENTAETIVVRNGRVVWMGDNVHQPQDVFSVTKSFVSTVLGLLIDDDRVTLDTRVSELVPSMSERYPDATLRHFVTQTSGYLAENESGFNLPEDPFAPAAPLFSPSGSRFAYTGTAMDMFANALTRAAGEPLQSLFQRRVADPIQMDPTTWDWGEFIAEDGVVVDGGSGFEGKGVVISASNAARLGHLFLNRGVWDGSPLVSSDWVDAATSVQVPSSLPHHSQSGVNSGPGVYGFGWWVLTDNWYDAIGSQNNYIHVNPALGFVVASLGTESGGITLDDYLSLQSSLPGVTVPTIWDEQGDGYWDELDASTGKPRWVTEDGMIPDIYPTTAATIRSNTVSVGDRLRIQGVRVETGRLHVEDAASLQADGRIKVDQGGEFLIDGSVEADSVDVEDNGVLVLHGSLLANSLEVTDGNITIHDGLTPLVISDRFRINGDSQLRFVISDEIWNSTIELNTRRAKPRFSGELALDFTAALDPKHLEGQSLNLLDWVDGAQPTTEFAEIVTPARVQVDVGQFYTSGEVVITSVLEKPLMPGDFSGDSMFDASDIDSLAARVRVDSTDAYFDLNDDQEVTNADMAVWVEEIAGTFFGDADFNGSVEFADFESLSSNFGQNGGWGQGDFDGTGGIEFADFLILSTHFGKSSGGVAAVPEPTSTMLVVVGFLPVFVMSRRVAQLTASNASLVEDFLLLSKHFGGGNRKWQSGNSDGDRHVGFAE